MMGFGGFGMMLGMVIFWVLIVGLALWLLGRLFPGARGQPATGKVRPPGMPVNVSARALQIIQERYARGELSRAEYQEIRKDLEG